MFRLHPATINAAHILRKPDLHTDFELYTKATGKRIKDVEMSFIISYHMPIFYFLIIVSMALTKPNVSLIVQQSFRCSTWMFARSELSLQAVQIEERLLLLFYAALRRQNKEIRCFPAIDIAQTGIK